MNIKDFFTTRETTLPAVIWPMIAGVIIAVVIAFFVKRTVGKTVRALISAGASDEKSAKSLAELGLGKSPAAKLALRGSSLKKLIFSTDGGRYYLPDETRFRAEEQYAGEKMSPLGLVLSAVILVVLGFLLIRFIPDFIQLGKNAANKFKPE